MIHAAGRITAGNSVIFVVGGSDEQRTDLVALLARLEREVVCLDSGEALLEQMLRDRPFVLISAMELPGINGMELLHELRDRGVHCPTILISDDGDIATAVDAMKAGAADFVERPFIDRVLLRRVEAALESSEMAGSRQS
jgi:FixJ family two-component response regulator